MDHRRRRRAGRGAWQPSWLLLFVVVASLFFAPSTFLSPPPPSSSSFPSSPQTPQLVQQVQAAFNDREQADARHWGNEEDDEWLSDDEADAVSLVLGLDGAGDDVGSSALAREFDERQRLFDLLAVTGGGGPIDVLPPPQLVDQAAVMAPNLQSMALTFDVNTNQAMPNTTTTAGTTTATGSTSMACDAIFTATSLTETFGPVDGSVADAICASVWQPSCVWLSPSSLSVAWAGLDRPASLDCALPRWWNVTSPPVLVLHSGVLRAATTSTSQTAEFLEESAARRAPVSFARVFDAANLPSVTPTAAITAPGRIGTCEPLRLVSGNAVAGNAGRPFVNLTWALLSPPLTTDAGFSNEGIGTILDALAHASNPASNTRAEPSTLRLLATSLPAGGNFTFSLRVTNWLGLSSALSSATVAKSTQAIPSIKIVGGSAFTVTRYEPISIVAVYGASSCASGSGSSAVSVMQLSWSVQSDDPAASALVQSVTQSSIALPAGRLLPSHFYIFTARVTDTGAPGQPSNQASVSYTVEAVPPPKLLAARFDEAVASISISFDADTNKANMTSSSNKAASTDCRAVLAPAFLVTVGDISSAAGAKCMWTDARTLLVVLGSGATVTPSTPVAPLWTSLRSADLFSVPMSAPIPAITPAPPSTPLMPVPLLRGGGASKLGRDEDLLLSASTSQGHGGRAFVSWTWSLVPDSAVFPPNDTSPTPTPLSSSQTALLQSFLSTVTGSELHVSSSLLVSGAVYEFSLSLTNFLGLSATATRQVTVSNEVLPQVSVLEEPPPAPLASDAITAKVGLSLPPSWPVDQMATMDCGWHVLPPHDDSILPDSMRSFSYSYVPPAPVAAAHVHTSRPMPVASATQRHLNAYHELREASGSSSSFSPHDGDDDEGYGRDADHAHDHMAASVQENRAPRANHFVWTQLPHILSGGTAATRLGHKATALSLHSRGTGGRSAMHAGRAADVSKSDDSSSQQQRQRQQYHTMGANHRRHMDTMASGSSTPSSTASLSTNAYFNLPPYSLIPGVVYEFVLQVTLRGANTTSGGSGGSAPSALTYNSAQLSISVGRSPLVASITGGDRLVTLKQGKPVTLDASHCYDPDSLALTGLLFSVGVTPSYSWSCRKVVTGLPCFSTPAALGAMAVDAAILSLAPKLFTDAMALDPLGTAQGFLFTVTLGLSDGTGRSASGSGLITVTTQEVPSVTILRLFLSPRPNAADSIKFQAIVEPTSGSYNLAWSLMAPEGAVLASSDSDTGLTSLDLALKGGVLQPGTKYTLQLLAAAVSAPANIGRGSLTFTTNMPPSGGSCSSTPSLGRSLDDAFSFDCTSWNDLAADQPLVYAFVLESVDDKGQDNSVYLASYSSLPSLHVDVMPAGKPDANYTQRVRVDVMDRLGAVTQTFITLQVFPSSLLSIGAGSGGGSNNGSSNMDVIYEVVTSLTSLVLGPAASSGNINAFAPAFLTVTSLLPSKDSPDFYSNDSGGGNSSIVSPELVEQRNSLLSQVAVLPNSVNTLATISQRLQLGNLVCNEPLLMDSSARALCTSYLSSQVSLARSSQFYAPGARSLTGSGSGESAAANAAPINAVPFAPSLTRVIFNTMDSVMGSTTTMLQELQQKASVAANDTVPAATSRRLLDANSTSSANSSALLAGQAEARAMVSLFLSVVHAVSQGSAINKLPSEAPTIVRTDSLFVSSQVHSISSLTSAVLSTNDASAPVASDGISPSIAPAAVSFPASLFTQGDLAGQLESNLVASTFWSYSSNLFAFLDKPEDDSGSNGPAGNGKIISGIVSVSLFNPSTKASAAPNISDDAEAVAVAERLGLAPPRGYSSLRVEDLRAPVRIAIEHAPIEQPPEFLLAPLTDLSSTEYNNQTNSSDTSSSNSDVVSRYHMIRLAQCQYYDTVSRAWSTRGCMVDVAHSTATSTVCLCNHLTDFGLAQVDFTVADLLPSTLNVASEADVLNLTWFHVTAHPIPLFCVLVVLAAYVFLLPVVHRWDVAQMVLWLEGKAWHRAYHDIAHLHLFERWTILLRATFVYRHLWLGVLYRRPGETFSATQKLTTCVSLLLGCMAISAFFRADTAVHAADSPHAPSAARVFFADWLIGVYSSLLILPIKMLVMFLFRRSGKSWKRLYAEYHLLKKALMEDVRLAALLERQEQKQLKSISMSDDGGEKNDETDADPDRHHDVAVAAARAKATSADKDEDDPEVEDTEAAQEEQGDSQQSSHGRSIGLHRRGVSKGAAAGAAATMSASGTSSSVKAFGLRKREQLLSSIQSSNTPRQIRRKLAAQLQSEHASKSSVKLEVVSEGEGEHLASSNSSSKHHRSVPDVRSNDSMSPQPTEHKSAEADVVEASTSSPLRPAREALKGNSCAIPSEGLHDSGVDQPPGSVPSPALVRRRLHHSGELTGAVFMSPMAEDGETALLKLQRSRAEQAATAQHKLTDDAMGSGNVNNASAAWTTVHDNPLTPQLFTRSLLRHVRDGSLPSVAATTAAVDVEDVAPIVESFVPALCLAEASVADAIPNATPHASASPIPEISHVVWSPTHRMDAGVPSTAKHDSAECKETEMSSPRKTKLKKTRVLWQPPAAPLGSTSEAAPDADADGCLSAPEEPVTFEESLATRRKNPKQKRQLWSPEWMHPPPLAVSGDLASSVALADVSSTDGFVAANARSQPVSNKRKQKRVLYDPQWLVEGAPAIPAIGQPMDASGVAVAGTADPDRLHALSSSIVDSLSQSASASLTAMRLLGLHDVAAAAVHMHDNNLTLPVLSEDHCSTDGLSFDAAWIASSAGAVAPVGDRQPSAVPIPLLSAAGQRMAAPVKPEPMSLDSSVEAILRQAREEAARVTNDDHTTPMKPHGGGAAAGKGVNDGVLASYAPDDVDRLDSGGWRLPHFMLYVSYALCLLWCAGASFVVVLYGLKFDLLDAERGLDGGATGWSSSAKWLANVLQAIAQDLLILEPMLIAAYTFLQLWLGKRVARWLTCCRATGDSGVDT